MKRITGTLALAVLALSMCACGSGRTKTAHDARTAPHGERDAFVCASGQNLATEYHRQSGTLALAIGDALLRLKEVESSGGSAKFSNGEVTFEDFDDHARLEIDGVVTECTRQLSE